tara:strand:- start:1129 stop:1977 length:849 start_codon:yes stop_codon:yes gene_type:complete
MTDIIERDKISTYSVAALLHQWGITPKVKNSEQIDFSYSNYEFSCVIQENIIFIHFGDIAFNLTGNCSLSEVQCELGSIAKRIGSGFCCSTAFKTKTGEIGIEVTYSLPILHFLVVDHLHFALKNYLSCSLKVFCFLKNIGYGTQVNHVFQGEDENSVSNKPTKNQYNSKDNTIPKRDACLSCEGKGFYLYAGGSKSNRCTICSGSGVRPEVAAKRMQELDDSDLNTLESNGAFGKQAYSDNHYDYEPEDESLASSYEEGNTMLDNDSSDWSAEMGNDGDDY